MSSPTLHFQRIAFAVNPSKQGAADLAAELEGIARDRGREAIRVDSFPVEREALEGVDLCCVLGGDGSILGVVDAAAHHAVPVLGFNFGRLGFMANFDAREAPKVFPGILDGQGCMIDHRSVLEVTDASGLRVLGLNDLVIKTTFSHLVHLEVRSGTNDVNDYYADGLIVATPTGSTAYNVAAGGPIVHPRAPVLVLTPVSPHTLSTRAIVLEETAELEIRLRSEASQIQIAVDGRAVFEPGRAFPLKATVCRARRFALLQHPDYSHFHILRQKLQWSGSVPSRLSPG